MAPDLVLTTASTIVCTHSPAPAVPAPPVPPPPIGGGGSVTVPGVSALRVNRQPVLPATPPAVTITGACSVPTNPPTNPCITPGSPSGPAVITAGAATKLQVNRVPVLLASSFAAVTPLGQPPAAFRVDANQQKLRAT